MSYSEGFRTRMIERITGPEQITAYALSKEVGVTPVTLTRWVRECSLGGVDNEKNKRRHVTFTAKEKFRIVNEARKLRDEELGEFLRREGLHEALLKEWTDVVDAGALAALNPPKRSKGKRTPEEKKIRALQKELNRKDKALAEVTAILTLKKRMQELWGDEDDDTDSRNES